MNKKIFMSMAVILMGTLVSGCASSTMPSNIGKNQQNVKKQLEVQNKTISDDNEAIESNIVLPIFSGGSNEEFLDELNKLVEENSLKFKEEINKMAEEDFKSFTGDAADFRKYEVMINYDVHTATDKFLSFTTLNYQYTGGAHGHTAKIPYNFDLTTGEEIVLEDLFKKESDFKKVLNEEIQKQIKENPDIFFPDEVELFSGINENQPFYVKDGKLILYFGQYDIAPYASGIIEFEIPNNILKDIMNLLL